MFGGEGRLWVALMSNCESQRSNKTSHQRSITGSLGVARKLGFDAVHLEVGQKRLELNFIDSYLFLSKPKHGTV